MLITRPINVQIHVDSPTYATFAGNRPNMTHIKKIRTYGMEKYKTAVKYCDRYLGDVKYIRPKGGISLWIDTEVQNQAMLMQKLMEKKIIISQGNQFMPSETNSTYIRLCFSNISEEKLEKGIRNIGLVLKEMKENEE